MYCVVRSHLSASDRHLGARALCAQCSSARESNMEFDPSETREGLHLIFGCFLDSFVILRLFFNMQCWAGLR